MTQQYGSDSGGSGMGGDPQLRRQAQQVGEQAKTQAKSALDQQARTAAEKLDHIADSVKAAAQRLEEDDDTGLSQYVSGMAGSLGDLADSLRSKNVDELVRDVRGMAQRNPALFITGSIAIGFGLARFARASAQRSHAGDGAYDAGEYGSNGLYGSSGYGSSGYGSSSSGTASSSSPYGSASSGGSVGSRNYGDDSGLAASGHHDDLDGLSASPGSRSTGTASGSTRSASTAGLPGATNPSSSGGKPS